MAWIMKSRPFLLEIDHPAVEFAAGAPAKPLFLANPVFFTCLFRICRSRWLSCTNRLYPAIVTDDSLKPPNVGAGLRIGRHSSPGSEQRTSARQRGQGNSVMIPW